MAKYEEYDDNIRESLIKLMMEIVDIKVNNYSYYYENKLLDITGSIGCWGIKGK